MTLSSADRRESPRLASSIPVKIKSNSGMDFVTETVNISRSGAYCQVNNFIEPMTKLTVNLLIPARRGCGKKVICGGVVVRTEPTAKNNFYNVAIFFNDISARNAALINDYIAEKIEKDSTWSEPSLN
jgi:hypothetical protein